MAALEKFSIRRPSELDLDELYSMIQESTCGRCRITKSKFRADLFGSSGEPQQPYESDRTMDDPVIDLDINLIKSNRTSCQAFVAEAATTSLLGHVVFHYHYSPWTGHTMFIDNVYVRSGYRKLGIAKSLVRRVSELAKSEGLPMLIFNSNDLDPKLLETVRGYNARVVRDNNTDWSVLRIDF